MIMFVYYAITRLEYTDLAVVIAVDEAPRD